VFNGRVEEEVKFVSADEGFLGKSMEGTGKEARTSLPESRKGPRVKELDVCRQPEEGGGVVSRVSRESRRWLKGVRGGK